ncbi:MFS transporter [Micromonospora sp. KC721]|uniref:MFS transporter n=1 Tax=Micromonospora sp. KC721 TaxID=2530380 RepID=UPI00104BED84|nr:MFS transporter [Micromonospora sp. KC721]TDB81624.1 MFS transporter [Micromonospora sp. KC721]
MTETGPSGSPEFGAAGRREWLALAVLALPTVLLAVDMSVLFLALPQLSVDLGADAVAQLWITDVYGFMVAGLLVTMGAVGDRVGRRRLLLVGAAAFAAASVLAAFSTSSAMLIATRAVLGVAGATLMPSTLALISDLFTQPRQRATAIAVWMSCFLAGNAAGPLVGGALLEFFWWGSAFLLGVPVMLLLLVTGPLLLPERRRPDPGRVDLPSVLLSLAAVLPIVYGLKHLARHGWHPVVPLATAVGVAAGVAFVRRQRALADPLLDLSLFARRAVRPVLVVLVAGGVLLGGSTLLVTQYLQLVGQLSPLRAGLWLLPSTLAMIVGTMLAPVLAARFGAGPVMASGLLVAAGGFAVLAGAGAGGTGAVLAGWTVVAFGNGLPAGLGVDLVVGAVPPQRAGAASGLCETSTEFGLATGIAVLGSAATAVYRGRLGQAVPDGIPAADAATALDGLSGALRVAHRLPEVLAPAREAYTAALAVVAVAGAVVSVALAVLTALALRPARSPGTGTASVGTGPPVPPANAQSER